MRILWLVLFTLILNSTSLGQTTQEIACHYSDDASILHHNSYHKGEMVLASGMFDDSFVWGSLIDLYLVSNKSDTEWSESPELVDVRAEGA